MADLTDVFYGIDPVERYQARGERPPALRLDRNPRPDPLGELAEAVDEAIIQGLHAARRLIAWARANEVEAVVRGIVLLGTIALGHLLVEAWMNHP